MQKILVIDDEKDISDILAGFLEPRGYAVTSASNGEDGLRKFDAENPDIVICDIKMPVMSGFEFLKELRDSRKWVPVVILTALTEPANIMKGYDLEADYYITKPVDLNEVLKAIQIMLSLAPLRKK